METHRNTLAGPSLVQSLVELIAGGGDMVTNLKQRDFNKHQARDIPTVGPVEEYSVA
jgi:hypothetical protein